MVYLVILLLAGAVMLALWRWCDAQRPLALLVAAALLLGLGGYVWQGQPRLAGKPAPALAERRQPDSSFAEQRTQLLDRFGSDAQILDAADAMHRAGYDDYAVGLIKGGIERNPGSADLWVGLGNALMLYAGGVVTPPAEFAFDRAEALAPGSPAPAYFRGLAYLQAGQPDRTIEIWSDLVAKAPATAPWRAEVASKIATLRTLTDASPAQR